MRAVNWNKENIAQTFWNQNISMFWTEAEFNVAKDLRAWSELSDAQREVYKRVLAGLTGLDTLQASDGMPLLSFHTDDHQAKAVLNFMGMMEAVHAKSYSHIFTTLLTTEETNHLLDRWVTEEEHLVYKAQTVQKFYLELLNDPSPLALYLAHAASVLLESFLFYSGFFYPLYLAGQGQMTTSGEIIRKIIMDESVHGVFVGIKAQEIYATLSTRDQHEADHVVNTLLRLLMGNEVAYTQAIYEPLGQDTVTEVVEYLKYNANKALQNLGRPAIYAHAPINPIVLNGLNTDTKSHDFFSVKGDGYVMALNVEDLRDEDFVF